MLLRLPLEIKDLFREWLEANQPGRAKHVMALVRSMRGGKDYDANWNTRMKGTGPYAEVMARRFHMAVKRLGLNQPSRPAGRPQVQAPCPAWRSARSFLKALSFSKRRACRITSMSCAC